MLTIAYQTRDSKKKAESIRAQGDMPAVFYGPKQESTSIILKAGEFKKVLKEAGESTVITLTGPQGDQEVLIHDIDVHPVSGVPLHADFYVPEKGKKIQVAVELEFVGVAPAVKDLGGILVKVLHEVEIEAMAKDLPHGLEVDISSLTALDSQILAGDIKLPSGVTLITGAEEVVAAVDTAKEEVEEVSTSIADIEVVGAKGKEEAAEGEAAE